MQNGMGDSIYALLKSVGSSSDGRSKSIYAPLSEGQSKAIVRAYERAGFGSETVELVGAHGTGTKAGDAAGIWRPKNCLYKWRSKSNFFVHNI